MKCYIYCPKAKPYLHREDDDTFVVSKYEQKPCLDYVKYYGDLNGKIVASFDLNKITHINSNLLLALKGNYCKAREVFDKVDYSNKELKEILEKSCLTLDEMLDYSKGKNLSAWHIENLEILDKPIEFGKHTHDNNSFFYTERIDKGVIRCGVLIKAPQSWQYVYDKNHNKCILISIKPEWFCKILNGEKTIELRKTAPKELIKNE